MQKISCEHTLSLVAAAVVALFYSAMHKHGKKNRYTHPQHIVVCVCARAERCACMNNLSSDFDIVLQRICYFHIFPFTSICVWLRNGEVCIINIIISGSVVMSYVCVFCERNKFATMPRGMNR